MSLTPQNLMQTQQRNIENVIAAQNHLFAGFEKLVNLNIDLVKSSLSEVAAQSQKVSHLQDVQQVAEFSTTVAQPAAEKALNYGKNVYAIFSELQKELVQLVEKQVNDNQEQAAVLVEQMAKNAPTGSESAIALVKAGLVASSNATDSLLKAGRQAADLNEANLNAVTGAAFKSVEQAAEVVEKNLEKNRKK